MCYNILLYYINFIGLFNLTGRRVDTLFISFYNPKIIIIEFKFSNLFNVCWSSTVNTRSPALEPSVVNDPGMCVNPWLSGLFARSDNFPVPGRTHNQWAHRVSISGVSLCPDHLSSPLSILHYLYKRSYYSALKRSFFTTYGSCVSYSRTAFPRTRMFDDDVQMRTRLFYARNIQIIFFERCPTPPISWIDAHFHQFCIK